MQKENTNKSNEKYNGKARNTVSCKLKECGIMKKKNLEIGGKQTDMQKKRKEKHYLDPSRIFSAQPMEVQYF